MKPVVFVDFETKPIKYALPPEPVGVSICSKELGISGYYAWDHPDENNCTKEEVVKRLRYLYANYEVGFHNSIFDLAVGTHHLGLPMPERVHDTLFLLFLRDPHAKTLALKPSAEAILGLPPTEQDALHDYILKAFKGATKSKVGAYIHACPGDVVAPYAIGDTLRTEELFKALHGAHKGAAYDRECELVKILVASTLQGVRLDFPRLEADFEEAIRTSETVKSRIFSYLGREFNLDSGEELANAIEAAGLPCQWTYTATGKRSTAKDNLISSVKDLLLIDLLTYRSTLTTYIESFMSRWLQEEVGGRIHFAWNQVRNQEQDKKGMMGTRTGRLSSTPSMLNVPKEPPVVPPHLGLPTLPNLRTYLLPEEGQLWLKRDYSQQELRLMAHYESGALLQAYIDNPKLDLHQYMVDYIDRTVALKITRPQAKTLVFAILYGLGLPRLAEKLNISYDGAKLLKGVYLDSVPGIREIQSAIKEKWSSNLPFRTAGGRYYYKEPDKVVIDPTTGLERIQNFIYKGLNYLIQGSAADVTKQAIVNYSKIKKEGSFLLSVHDELDISGPKEEMPLLEEAMTDLNLGLELPLLSEGYMGNSYGTLEDY